MKNESGLFYMITSKVSRFNATLSCSLLGVLRKGHRLVPDWLFSVRIQRTSGVHCGAVLCKRSQQEVDEDNAGNGTL